MRSRCMLSAPADDHELEKPMTCSHHRRDRPALSVTWEWPSGSREASSLIASASDSTATPGRRVFLVIFHFLGRGGDHPGAPGADRQWGGLPAVVATAAVVHPVARRRGRREQRGAGSGARCVCRGSTAGTRARMAAPASSDTPRVLVRRSCACMA
jgi:hypothetical protein